METTSLMVVGWDCGEIMNCNMLHTSRWLSQEQTSAFLLISRSTQTILRIMFLILTINDHIFGWGGECSNACLTLIGQHKTILISDWLVSRHFSTGTAGPVVRDTSFWSSYFSYHQHWSAHDTNINNINIFNTMPHPSHHLHLSSLTLTTAPSRVIIPAPEEVCYINQLQW